jgi:hypothetical protein
VCVRFLHTWNGRSDHGTAQGTELIAPAKLLMKRGFGNALFHCDQVNAMIIQRDRAPAMI